MPFEMDLLSLLFIGCKKEEKQHNLRLVIDGGKYVSTISRIANDKRTPVAIDTISGHLDVTIDAVNANDLLLVQVANVGDDAVNLSVHTTGELTNSYTVNNGDKPYHQYFMFTHPSEATQRQLGNEPILSLDNYIFFSFSSELLSFAISFLMRFAVTTRLLLISANNTGSINCSPLSSTSPICS